jgi:hypothetical protein
MQNSGENKYSVASLCAFGAVHGMSPFCWDVVPRHWLISASEYLYIISSITYQ